MLWEVMAHQEHPVSSLEIGPVSSDLDFPGFSFDFHTFRDPGNLVLQSLVTDYAGSLGYISQI